MPSDLLLSTHLPTSEGWTAELAVGLRLVVPRTGLEPTRVNPTRFEALRLNDSASTPYRHTITVLCQSLLNQVEFFQEFSRSNRHSEIRFCLDILILTVSFLPLAH